MIRPARAWPQGYRRPNGSLGASVLPLAIARMLFGRGARRALLVSNAPVQIVDADGRRLTVALVMPQFCFNAVSVTCGCARYQGGDRPPVGKMRARCIIGRQ